MTRYVIVLAAVIVALSAYLVWFQLNRDAALGTQPPAGAPTDEASDERDAMPTFPGGEAVTAQRVREACEHEIVLRSDLPFTEFPRPGTPEYSEPVWVVDLDAWVWVVELVYEEGMALRREWECRISGDGQGLVRRNY